MNLIEEIFPKSVDVYTNEGKAGPAGMKRYRRRENWRSRSNSTRNLNRIGSCTSQWISREDSGEHRTGESQRACGGVSIPQNCLEMASDGLQLQSREGSADTEDDAPRRRPGSGGTSSASALHSREPGLGSDRRKTYSEKYKSAEIAVFEVRPVGSESPAPPP